VPAIRRTEQTCEEWRPGVQTLLRVSGASGSTQLCVMEQWSAPGQGAPSHRHPDAEELLLVLEGSALVTVEGDEEEFSTGDVVVIAPGARHGFVNGAAGVLHTMAVFSSATPTVCYDAAPDEPVQIGASATKHRVALRE